MSKVYRVVIKEVLIWPMTIEANSEDEARDLALEESNSDWESTCLHYDVDSCREITDETDPAYMQRRSV